MMKGAALPLAVLGGTAVVATLIIVAKQKSGAQAGALPQLADDVLHNKVISTIAAATNPGALRTLAAGLVKQGGLAEAAAANIKAATIDKGAAAVATAQAVPTAAATTQAATQAITSALSTISANQPTIRNGSSGAAVLQWQGYLLSQGIQLTVDGQFGPETVAATQAWQTAHGLTADGVVGPATWAKALSP